MPKNYRDPSTAKLNSSDETEMILTVLSHDRVRPYKVDFRRWLYVGRPSTEKIDVPSARARLQLAGRSQLVSALYEISAQAKEEVLGNSLGEYLRTGIRVFFEFLDERLIKEGTNVTAVSEINRSLMVNFVDYLKRKKKTGTSENISVISANSLYKSATNLLRRFVNKGMLPRDTFPANPFPGAANADKKHNIPYSKAEVQRILAALKKDLVSIRNGTFPVKSANYSTGVYFALIAAYTGINTTSLAELTLQGIQPNPLGENWILLTTIKRRNPNGSKVERRTIGNANANQATTSQTANDAKPTQIDRTVHALLLEVVALSQEARELAPVKMKNYVFIYVDHSARGAGKIQRFELGVSRSMQSIVARHDLRDDMGVPMVLRVSRLRVTEGDRIYQETNSIQLASEALKHSLRVHGSHYAPITTDMERNFAFVGRALEVFARNCAEDDAYIDGLAKEIGIDRSVATKIFQGHWNTGVGRCSDPFNGRFASKNGHPCTKFLYCFRCPNMVVIGHPDDLYRLFSFYYFLVHERLRIGAKAWKKAYRHVIRIIDDEIAPKFSTKLVSDARTLAQRRPHPMWTWLHYEAR